MDTEGTGSSTSPPGSSVFPATLSRTFFFSCSGRVQGLRRTVAVWFSNLPLSFLAGVLSASSLLLRLALGGASDFRFPPRGLV